MKIPDNNNYADIDYDDEEKDNGDDDDDDDDGGGGQGFVQEEIAGQPCEEPWRGAELVRIIIRHIGIIIGNHWNHHWTHWNYHHCHHHN